MELRIDLRKKSFFDWIKINQLQQLRVLVKCKYLLENDLYFIEKKLKSFFFQIHYLYLVVNHFVNNIFLIEIISIKKMLTLFASCEQSQHDPTVHQILDHYKLKTRPYKNF
ncbi:hypothetical protein BpHYR1_001111 [Brachionus plicatilis]|uniref:Uncharacterized protein n=1 Tax=Brachionus plicatilis TaxID=10195 RepID=A0A3M7S7K2_BRAPC|nr:hypothetical protein BpHYR1_001111 [Brachionus plicatilis]